MTDMFFILRSEFITHAHVLAQTSAGTRLRMKLILEFCLLHLPCISLSSILFLPIPVFPMLEQRNLGKLHKHRIRQSSGRIRIYGRKKEGKGEIGQIKRIVLMSEEHNNGTQIEIPCRRR